MAVPGPAWANRAGLLASRAPLSLSKDFLAMWPVFPQIWHFLSSINIGGCGQFSFVCPGRLQLAHLLSFGSLGGVFVRPDVPNLGAHDVELLVVSCLHWRISPYIVGRIHARLQ